MDFQQYFFSHPDSWFNSQKKYDEFINVNFGHHIDTQFDDVLLNIIINDQLPYYLYRDNTDKIRQYQQKALEYAKTIIDNDEFYKYNPTEQCFIMMPFRHSNDIDNNYKILNKVKELMEKSNNMSSSTLMKDALMYKRFYKATLLKLGSLLNEKAIDDINEANTFDVNILDETSTFNNFHRIPNINYSHIWEYFYDFYKDYDTICVSLSGGVDSMLLLHLLKMTNKNIIAFHLNYSNRDTSNDERDMCICYCRYFNIPIIVRNITEIKRNRHKDRELYEEVTRKIRFGMYKLIQEKYNHSIIALGHNKDDCLENIFSNIIKCQKYSNLSGMSNFSEEDNVYISRPFLNTYKKDIYKMANEYCLPYLYDSTPKWSERGKKRDILFPQLNDFDERILPGMYKLSEHLSSVMNIYNKSIANNYVINNKEIYIKNIYDYNYLVSTLDMACQELKIPYFSRKSIGNLYKYHKDGRKIMMNKEYYFYNNCLYTH